jgi:hypothetical protein
MFSLRRKPDAERNFSVLLDEALAKIDPSRFETSLDGAITCQPVVQTLNQLAGNSDRFAAVDLEALMLALAQSPESTIIENLGKECASDLVVVAVMVGALRYVKRKDTNSEIDKKNKTIGDTAKSEWSPVA